MKNRLIALLLLGIFSSPTTRAGDANNQPGNAWFSVPKMESGLALAVDTLYLYKADVLKKIIEVIHDLPRVQGPPTAILRDPTSARIFVLNVVDPFLSDIHTEYMEKYITPQLKKTIQVYNGRYSIRSLRDFPKSDILILASLKIAQSALSSIKPFITTDEDKLVVQGLIGDLGRAIASSGESSDLLELSLKMNAPGVVKFLDAASTSARTQGLALMTRGLFEYLKE